MAKEKESTVKGEANSAMMNSSKTRYNRFLFRIAIFSVFVIALCGFCIGFIASHDYFTDIGDLFYSVSYYLVYFFIFIFLTSTILLIVNLIRRKPDT